MRLSILPTLLAVAAFGAACGSDDSNPSDQDVQGSDVIEDSLTGEDPGTPDTSMDDGALDGGLGDTAPVDYGIEDPGYDGTLLDISEDAWVDPLVPVLDGDILRASNGTLTLEVNLPAGTFSLGKVPGQDGIINAFFMAKLTVQGAPLEIRSTDEGPNFLYQSSFAPMELGEGMMLQLDATPNGKMGGLRTYIQMYRDLPIVTIRTLVAMPTRDGVLLESISPVVVDSTLGGGVYLGPDTDESALIENGYESAFDFRADLWMVGDPTITIAGPGYASNWSAALCSPTGSCLIGGFTTMADSAGLISTDHLGADAIEVDGNKAISYFEARSPYLPSAALGANKIAASEQVYLDFTTDVAEGLARYATISALISTANTPAKGLSVWDSTTGGSEDGGYGENIDQVTIVDNINAATALVPYGLDAFVVGLGWQADDGSWTSNKTRFPLHGSQDSMAWLRDQIETGGMVPGIRVSPFLVEKNGAFATAHPDWVIELDSMAKAALGLGVNAMVLDLTNEDALDWVKGLFDRIVNDWGYDIVRVDDARYAAHGATYSITGRSGVTVFRNALAEIREVVGDEVLIWTDSGTGTGTGLADVADLTLPNKPVWGDPFSPWDQGIKASLLTAAHRFFLSNTWFAGNPGAVFLRDDGGLTLDEATAWTTFAGMFGGVVELGDPLVDLADDPVALALARRLLPTTSTMAVPADFTALRYPQAWTTALGNDGSFAAGIFNWGENRNTEGDSITESDTAISVPVPEGEGNFAVIDVFSGKLLNDGNKALLDGPISLTLASRTSRLFVARPVAGLDQPIYLATDRWLGANQALATISANAVTFDNMVVGVPTKAWFLSQKGALVTAQGDASDISTTATDFDDATMTEVTFTPTVTTVTLSVGIGG